jgi:hypothetical protein
MCTGSNASRQAVECSILMSSYDEAAVSNMCSKWGESVMHVRHHPPACDHQQVFAGIHSLRCCMNSWVSCHCNCVSWGNAQPAYTAAASSHHRSSNTYTNKISHILSQAPASSLSSCVSCCCCNGMSCEICNLHTLLLPQPSITLQTHILANCHTLCTRAPLVPSSLWYLEQLRQLLLQLPDAVRPARALPARCSR